jgi:hypothetical protein
MTSASSPDPTDELLAYVERWQKEAEAKHGNRLCGTCFGRERVSTLNAEHPCPDCTPPLAVRLFDESLHQRKIYPHTSDRHRAASLLLEAAETFVAPPLSEEK